MDSINQTYTVISSRITGVTNGEMYHWKQLLEIANVRNLQTLSSSKNFFIYSNDDKQEKLLTATSKESN